MSLSVSTLLMFFPVFVHVFCSHRSAICLIKLEQQSFVYVYAFVRFAQLNRVIQKILINIAL